MDDDRSLSIEHSLIQGVLTPNFPPGGWSPRADCERCVHGVGFAVVSDDKAAKWGGIAERVHRDGISRATRDGRAVGAGVGVALAAEHGQDEVH